MPNVLKERNVFKNLNAQTMDKLQLVLLDLTDQMVLAAPSNEESLVLVKMEFAYKLDFFFSLKN